MILYHESMYCRQTGIFEKFMFLKSDSQVPKSFLFICFNDSLSKKMKNAFYFILKTFSILKIFNKFSSWLFGHVKKTNMIRNRKLSSKFMTSQPGKQRITTHILFNIPQIKGNQTMKFRQLIEHPKRNINIMQKMTQIN